MKLLYIMVMKFSNDNRLRTYQLIQEVRDTTVQQQKNTSVEKAHALV